MKPAPPVMRIFACMRCPVAPREVEAASRVWQMLCQARDALTHNLRELVAVRERGLQIQRKTTTFLLSPDLAMRLLRTAMYGILPKASVREQDSLRRLLVTR